MFSLVLDCPFCSKRFNFDHGGNLPENITCPECGGTAANENFSAIIFCPECRKKLRIPLDIINADIYCPYCETPLKANMTFVDEDVSTYTLGGSKVAESTRLLNDGDTFDKYRIIRMLGKGGMAEVYLAEHLLLNQKCALKLMQKNIASDDPVFVKRFIREAKLSHRFDHPNIVKVVDAGTDFKTGHLFLTMEYVEGKTVSQMIREKALDEPELLKILYSMLQALNVLHEAGVVHRDIKPSNIMLGADGVYKLMDLGIAKSQSDKASGELTLTMERSTLGTPGYASPEQCRSAHDADIRSDLYCLGATLYHAASGKIPFDGTTTMEIILKVIQEEAEPLSKLRPDLSWMFHDLISRMMKKDPDERPKNPQAVIDILMTSKRSPANFLQKQCAKIKTVFIRNQSLPDVKKKQKKFSWTFAILLLIFAGVIGCYIKLNFFQQQEKSRRNIPRRVSTPPEKNVPATVRHRAAASRPFSPASRQAAPVSVKTPPDKTADTAVQSPAVRNRSQAPESPRRVNLPLQNYHNHLPPPVRHQGGSWAYTLTDIFFNKSNIEYVENFTSANNLSGLPEGAIKNGVLVLNNTLWTPEQAQHGLRWKAAHSRPEVFTLSVNMRLTEELKGRIFINDMLEISVPNVYKLLSIRFLKNYGTICNFTPPIGQWFNLTIHINCRKKMLSILSSNRLIGCYLLPNNVTLPSENSISFKGASNWPVSVELSQIVCYGSDWQHSLPDKIRSRRNRQLIAFSTEKLPEKQQLSPKAVSADSSSGRASDTHTRNTENENQMSKPVPKPVWRPISVRLAECRRRYSAVQAQPDSKYKKHILNFISAQISELQKQQNIRNAVLAAKRRKYSPQATLKFKNTVQEYYNSRRNHGGYDSKDIRKGREIANLLKNPAVDPNVFFKNSRIQTPYFLGNLIIDGHLQYKDNFIKLAKEKFMDFNLLVRQTPSYHRIGGYTRIDYEILSYGLEDIDNWQDAPLVFSTFQAKGSLWTTAGCLSTDEYTNKFLKLAPLVDVIYPPDGSTLMHIAAKHNKITLAKNLYFAGFTLFKTRDRKGQSAWDAALESGSKLVADFLREIGQATPETSNKMYQIELYNALHSKNISAIRELIGKADFHKPFFNGLTAVEYACALNDMNILTCLKNSGINFQNDSPQSRSYYCGVTHPLKTAVLLGNNRMLEFLLKQGLSTNKEFPHFMNGRAHLPSIILYYKNKLGEQRAVQLIYTILRYDKGFDINQHSYGRTMLSEVAVAHFQDQHLQANLVKYILSRGAKIIPDGIKHSYERNWPARVKNPLVKKLLNL